MKLNKKGFMMVEVVVVAAIILGVLTSIYTSYSKVFYKYARLLDYYNPDAVYNLACLRDKAISYMCYTDHCAGMNINEDLEWIDGENPNLYWIGAIPASGAEYCFHDSNFRQNNVWFVRKENIIDFRDNPYIENGNPHSQAFKDYLTYLDSAVNFRDDVRYIMVAEFTKTSGNSYYGYLELEA